MTDGKRMSDLMRAQRMGISLTELRRRREEVSKMIAGTAAKAYANALAEHLIADGHKKRLFGRVRFGYGAR